MLTDIYTIIWKEARELFLKTPHFRGGWLGLGALLVVFGVVMPYQSGPEWIASPQNLFFWSWVPYLLVSSMVVDSFAGERERHTLETLLATRLSDSAILLGKIGAALLYGWGLTVVGILVALVTFNVTHWSGRVVLFSPVMAAGVFGISFLVALLAAGLGVLVSLRASSVRQGQQTFSFLFILLLLPMLLFPMLPGDLQYRLTTLLIEMDIPRLIAGVITGLILLNTARLAAARASFRRSRLLMS